MATDDKNFNCPNSKRNSLFVDLGVYRSAQ